MRQRIAWLTLLCALPLAAEQLITRTFSKLDGLAADWGTLDLLQDSRGFIWIATQFGVSRFDGQQFQNYSVQDGLGYPYVNRILETRSGQIWMATNGGGVSRYDPRSGGPPRFVTYPTGSTPESKSVNSLQESPDGTIWASTDCGLYALEKGAAQFHLAFLPDRPAGKSSSIQAIIDTFSESSGVLWIASDFQGLFRRNADGSLDRWSVREGIPDYGGGFFFKDRAAQVWLVTERGALALDLHARPGVSPILRRLEAPGGHALFWRMVQDRSGAYWLSGEAGLMCFDATGSRLYGLGDGLPGRSTGGLMEDRDGNLWAGVLGVGVVRIVRNQFTAWSSADGLSLPGVIQIFPRESGRVAVLSGNGNAIGIEELEGRRFHPLTPPIRVPHRASHPALHDHLGDWWVATEAGVERYRGGRLLHRYGPSEGWPASFETALYEDRAGDIWVLHWGAGSSLGLWKRSRNRIEAFADTPASPASADPFLLVEDTAGAIWIGSSRAGLFRWKQGSFTHVPSAFPASERFEIYSLSADPTGRIWAGYTQGGLGEVADPGGPQPHIRRIPLPATLGTITAIVADQQRTLYLGTRAGLVWFDPATQRTATFGESVSALAGVINTAARDAAGNLWFGTGSGLVRLTPPAQPFTTAPPIRLTQVRLNDGQYPLSDWGEQTVTAPAFSASQNRLEFSFSGLAGPARLRYRYRLEPQDRHWSEISSERSVLYPRLPPGGYRFAVQAVDPAGNTSAREASFAFEIAAPFWLRPWFVALCVLATVGLLSAAYRIRVRSLLAVERLRTRIATDLHDDLGSSLSQVAIISELVCQHLVGQHVGIGDDKNAERLARIARIARESMSALADCVWTIDPHHDTLGEMAARMRRFGNDLFAPRDIEFTFDGPPADAACALDPELRRALFLIFKESLHNAARHSRAAAVRAALHRRPAEIELCVEDNGVGFHRDPLRAGHGLSGMERRVAQLGGTFSLRSTPGEGTFLMVTLPLSRFRPRTAKTGGEGGRNRRRENR